jgi:hypothetical protein
MKDNFANTKNQGYLKNNYNENSSMQQEPKPKSPLQTALKRKRKKLSKTILGIDTDDEL